MGKRFPKMFGPATAIRGALCVALACAALPAHADNRTTVRATVTTTCDLFLFPMMFGNIPIFLPNVTTQSPIDVTCTPNTPFAITMDDGQNFNGQRRMARTGAGFGAFLNYEIYQDAARTKRWGATAGQRYQAVAPASGKMRIYAYGAANGFINSGAFQDQVTVTITF